MSQTNFKIYVDTDEMKAVLEEFKKEQLKLQELFSSYNTDIIHMNEYWSGDNGDEASQRLQKYSKSFDTVSNKLSKNIAFLGKVIEHYENTEIELEKNTERVLNN